MKNFLLLLVYHMALPLIYSQTAEPFSKAQLISIYHSYKKNLPPNLERHEVDFFLNGFIKGFIHENGIDFAPTKRVREELENQGIDSVVIASLRDEIYKERGVELYVFSYDSPNQNDGQEFAQLIHHEIENRKSKILFFMDRKIFPPSVFTYESWRENIPSHYAIYITGSLYDENGKSFVNSRIRLRPARTKQDLYLDIEPLVLEALADRATAKKIATWFVDSLEVVFSD